MRSLLQIVMLPLLMSQCGSSPPPHPRFDLMPFVLHEGAMSGQACPIGPRTLATVAHLVKGPRAELSLRDVRYEAFPRKVQKERDLAILVIISDEPLPSWYEVAKKRPLPGETVWLKGFLWDGTPAPYGGRVLNVASDGFLVVDSLISPGSSGSCILNEKGEVVGVAARGLHWGNEGVRPVAAGPLLAGEKY